MAGFRAAPYCCVFDGQSLNFVPTLVNNYPTKVMAALAGYGFPQPVPSTVPEGTFICIGGTGWVDLASAGSGYESLTVRGGHYAHAGKITCYMMCGGTTDIQANRTAAQIYADMGSLAVEAKSLGFDYVFAATTTPYTGFTGAQETIRDDTNALILADASNRFDGVADWTANATLENPASAAYADGLHFTDSGATLAAGIMETTMRSVLGLA